MVERQKLDCNCSDCKSMVRSLILRQESVDLHFRWQKDYFDGKRTKKLIRAKFWADKKFDNEEERQTNISKAKLLIKEARKMVFQFDESECAIHYGNCIKFDKDVSFIPEVLQLDTQECFMHRID